jgi:hypothetical protein
VKSSKYAYVDIELLNYLNFNFFGLKKKKMEEQKIQVLMIGVSMFLKGMKGFFCHLRLILGWRNYMGKGNFDFCVFKP